MLGRTSTTQHLPAVYSCSRHWLAVVITCLRQSPKSIGKVPDQQCSYRIFMLDTLCRTVLPLIRGLAGMPCHVEGAVASTLCQVTGPHCRDGLSFRDCWPQRPRRACVAATSCQEKIDRVCNVQSCSCVAGSRSASIWVNSTIILHSEVTCPHPEVTCPPKIMLPMK